MDIKELILASNQPLNRHPWELARLQVILSLFKRLMLSHQQSSLPMTTIDIGCGDVFVAEQLAMRFPSLQFLAIDEAFNENLILALRAKLRVDNVNLYPSFAHAVELHKRPADFVLLLDVIEHIADDKTFMAELCQSHFLSEKARILITVPAFQSLYCSHDTFLNHYRRYNSKQLRQLVERSGFEVIEQGYFFSSLLIPRLLQVFLEKRVKNKSKIQKGVSNWQGSAWKNKIIKRVLVTDFQLLQLLHKLGINLPGLSCYSVCQKRKY